MREPKINISRLGYALAFIMYASIVSSCQTQDQWQKAIPTPQVAAAYGVTGYGSPGSVASGPFTLCYNGENANGSPHVDFVEGGGTSSIKGPNYTNPIEALGKQCKWEVSVIPSKSGRTKVQVIFGNTQTHDQFGSYTATSSPDTYSFLTDLFRPDFKQFEVKRLDNDDYEIKVGAIDDTAGENVRIRLKGGDASNDAFSSKGKPAVLKYSPQAYGEKNIEVDACDSVGCSTKEAKVDVQPITVSNVKAQDLNNGDFLIKGIVDYNGSRVTPEIVAIGNQRGMVLYPFEANSISCAPAVVSDGQFTMTCHKPNDEGLVTVELTVKHPKGFKIIQRFELEGIQDVAKWKATAFYVGLLLLTSSIIVSPFLLGMYIEHDRTKKARKMTMTQINAAVAQGDLRQATQLAQSIQFGKNEHNPITPVVLSLSAIMDEIAWLENELHPSYIYETYDKIKAVENRIQVVKMSQDQSVLIALDCITRDLNIVKERYFELLHDRMKTPLERKNIMELMTQTQLITLLTDLWEIQPRSFWSKKDRKTMIHDVFELITIIYGERNDVAKIIQISHRSRRSLFGESISDAEYYKMVVDTLCKWGHFRAASLFIDKIVLLEEAKIPYRKVIETELCVIEAQVHEQLIQGNVEEGMKIAERFPEQRKARLAIIGQTVQISRKLVGETEQSLTQWCSSPLIREHITEWTEGVRVFLIQAIRENRREEIAEFLQVFSTNAQIAERSMKRVNDFSTASRGLFDLKHQPNLDEIVQLIEQRVFHALRDKDGAQFDAIYKTVEELESAVTNSMSQVRAIDEFLRKLFGQDYQNQIQVMIEEFQDDAMRFIQEHNIDGLNGIHQRVAEIGKATIPAMKQIRELRNHFTFFKYQFHLKETDVTMRLEEFEQETMDYIRDGDVNALNELAKRAESYNQILNAMRVKEIAGPGARLPIIPSSMPNFRNTFAQLFDMSPVLTSQFLTLSLQVAGQI